MREWYGGDRRIERTLLVLLIRASNRTEIVLGSRARKKMRESAVRRVTRRANQLLAAGGEGAVDDALRHAVTAVLKALKKQPGLLGGLRGMLMPLIIGAVLLYGAEAWALSAAELERLEVVVRSLLRGALPARLRRPDGVRLLSNAALRQHFRVPTVGAMLARKQLGYAGHLARMDEDQLPRRMLGARRVVQSAPGRGRRGASMLGVFGCPGTLRTRLMLELTTAARREFFGGARGPWFELAQGREAWRRFVRSVR